MDIDLTKLFISSTLAKIVGFNENIKTSVENNLITIKVIVIFILSLLKMIFIYFSACYLFS